MRHSRISNLLLQLEERHNGVNYVQNVNLYIQNNETQLIFYYADILLFFHQDVCYANSNKYGDTGIVNFQKPCVTCTTTRNPLGGLHCSG